MAELLLNAIHDNGVNTNTKVDAPTASLIDRSR